MNADLSVVLKNLEYCKQLKKVNEEETKMYLVYPFLAYLGYSVFSPQEVKFEFECDMHEHGARRVDCALFSHNIPIIIIEAKPFGTDLSAHWGQIKSYFIPSGAHFAILTDGNFYHLFERSQIDANFQSSSPKYIFALNQLAEQDKDILCKLSKVQFLDLSSIPIVSESFAIKKCIRNDAEGFTRLYSAIDSCSIKGRMADELYSEYIDYCSKNNYPSYSRIGWSRKMVKTFSLHTKQKRYGSIRVTVFI